MNSGRKGLQLQSTITSEGKLRLALVEVETSLAERDEVVVRMEAAPINPSDVGGLLLDLVDKDTMRVSGTPERPVVTADIPDTAMSTVWIAARVGISMPAGNEGAGVVVEAGASLAAQALIGRTVAFMGPPSYSQYRCVTVDQCLILPEGVTPGEAASSFVNPLTALGMVETMRLEGHNALVHTAGASNLGQMLLRLCVQEGVELINIVRNPQQEELLRSMGANWVCNSSSPSFKEDLTEALLATGATLAFDAIGGGPLAGQVLTAMETAISRRSGGRFGGYGTAVHKQVYIYGGLDRAPTDIRRNFGMAWGMGGWLMPYFLERVGPGAVRRLKDKVASEIRTTFASTYTKEISLREALQEENIFAYAKQATGEKYLINPNKDA